MPKFTEKELEAIQRLLLDKGKALFIEYGLKKTSIDNIVQACDIAKGSFYKFYSSKEELYFEIFKNEEKPYLQIYQSILGVKENGVELMTKLINDLWNYLCTNQFLQSCYERNERDHLYRKISLEDLQLYTLEQHQKYIQVVKILQANGKISKINPETIVAMIRGVLMMSLQKVRIGEQFYGDVMVQMIQFIGEGLGKQSNS